MEEYFLLGPLGQRILKGQCRLAFDIGANKGEWTHWLSTKFDHVISVEPDPRAHGYLRRHLPANAKLYPYAASSAAGQQDFYMRDNPDQSSLLEVHPIGAGDQKETHVVNRVSVNAVTLDGLLAIAKHELPVNGVDFIKVDVEGAEHLVLNGATPALFRNTRWLIEVHDNGEVVGRAVRRLGHENIAIVKHPYANAHPNHFWILVNETR